MSRVVLLLFAALVSFVLRAGDVRTSLLIIDPGSAFFTCAGHAVLRLESPDYGLDLCFSYESEPMGFLLGRFLAGNLKMGMFVVPTKEFLEPYGQDGRGVRAYRLDLPQEVQRTLWIVLDEKVKEGIELPYDYLTRGCAQSVLRCLAAAAERRRYQLVFPGDSPCYHQTCRELFGKSIPDYPWTFLFLHLIVGTDADRDGPPLSHVFVPADLLGLLKATRIEGHPVLADDGVPLLPSVRPPVRPCVTPTEVAWFLLFLTILAAACRKRIPWLSSVMTVVLLTLSTLIGLIAGYTVFCTSIPGTTWNWLLVPFNPLPLIFWKRRRIWALPHVIVVAVWIVCTLLAPHTLTHPAYLLLAVACALHFLRDSFALRATLPTP